MSRMLVLLFAAVVLNLTEARSVGSSQLAKEIVKRYNEEFKKIGKTQITNIGDGLFANMTIGKLDTVVLRGKEQVVNRTVNDDGVHYEVNLEFGLKEMYAETELLLGDSWKVSSKDGSANIKISVSVLSDSNCTASLNSLTVHKLGKITVTVKPDTPINKAIEAYWQNQYARNAAVYIKIINKGVSDELAVIGPDPEFHNITCAVFKSLEN